MDKILDLAEKEMMDLKQPYVGSHHFLLAYLKDSNEELYNEFKNIVIRVIGSCQKKSPRVLYTPYMRDLAKSNLGLEEAIKHILNDENSIVYNLLLSHNIDEEKLLNNI